MSMFGRSDRTADASVAESNGGPEPSTSSHDKGRRTERSRQDTVPSLIAAGLRVKGNLESGGEIQVDGEVEGDVRGKTVTVGREALVKGSVLGDTVTIAGTIEGKVEAMTVTLEKTARMMGDIIHQALQIDSGALVDGHCSPHSGKAEVRHLGPKAVASAAGPASEEPHKVEAAGTKEH